MDSEGTENKWTEYNFVQIEFTKMGLILLITLFYNLPISPEMYIVNVLIHNLLM